MERSRKERAKLTSVEALGWWLADRPQTEAHRHFVQTRLLLDRETDERLLYLSKRFSIPKTTLLRELVRAAVKDIFAVIPGDPPPTALAPDLRGAGVDSERLRWFDLESVKEDEEREEQILKFEDLDEEPLDQETANRIWRAIRNDIGLEDPGEEEPGS
jgi:hypothetical protein